MIERVGGLIERVRLKEGLDAALGVVREANAYLNETEPWKTIKTDEASAARTVYTILRVIDNLKTALAPYLPFSSQEVHEYLGYDGQLFGDLNIVKYAEETRSHRALVYDGSAAIGRWEVSALQPGQKLRKPSPLFTKLDEAVIEYERGFLGKPREEMPIEA